MHYLSVDQLLAVGASIFGLMLMYSLVSCTIKLLFKVAKMAVPLVDLRKENLMAKK